MAETRSQTVSRARQSGQDRSLRTTEPRSGRLSGKTLQIAQGGQLSILFGQAANLFVEFRPRFVQTIFARGGGVRSRHRRVLSFMPAPPNRVCSRPKCDVLGNAIKPTGD